MAFTTGTDDTTLTAAVFNETHAYFNGSASAGSNPISLITLNDSTNPVLTLKNLDTTNGRVLQLYKADGTSLLKVTKDGVRISVDGTTADQTPAVLSAAQTFSAAQNFGSTVGVSGALTASSTLGVTGVATLGSSLISTPAANTSSASSLTLPAGRYIPITGVVTINSIAAGTAGREVVLVFASAACTVKAAAISGANGDYISTAGGTLTLWSDGSNWHEAGRSGASVPGARYYISAATQSITSGAERIVSWTATDYNYGLTAATTSAPVPGILGRWLIEAAVHRDPAALSNFRGFLLKNGSDLQQVVGDNPADAETLTGSRAYYGARVVEVTSLTDTYGLGLISGNTADIIGLISGSSLTFTFLGR